MRVDLRAVMHRQPCRRVRDDSAQPLDHGPVGAAFRIGVEIDGGDVPTLRAHGPRHHRVESRAIRVLRQHFGQRDVATGLRRGADGAVVALQCFRPLRDLRRRRQHAGDAGSRAPVRLALVDGEPVRARPVRQRVLAREVQPRGAEVRRHAEARVDGSAATRTIAGLEHGDSPARRRAGFERRRYRPCRHRRRRRPRVRSSNDLRTADRRVPCYDSTR